MGWDESSAAAFICPWIASFRAFCSAAGSPVVALSVELTAALILANMSPRGVVVPVSQSKLRRSAGLAGLGQGDVLEYVLLSHEPVRPLVVTVGGRGVVAVRLKTRLL